MYKQKHSGFGIASFITSIVSGGLIFLLIVIAGFIEASTPGGMDEESVIAVIIGLFILAFLGAAFLGLGLGIAGLLQMQRKKVFAILGTIFSAAALLGTMFIIALGLTME
jgi:hypothetical protein